MLIPEFGMLAAIAPSQSDPTAVADGWRRLNPVNRLLLGWLDSAGVRVVVTAMQGFHLTSSSVPADSVPAQAILLLRVSTAGDDM